MGTEGCTGAGRTGWHIDGTFQEKPFKYQTMHFHSVCEGGETWFVPLKEFYQMQDEETRERWNRYWMITFWEEYAYPMVYQHPTLGDPTLMFQCGPAVCSGWAVDSQEEDPKQMRPQEIIASHVVQAELTTCLNEAVDKIGLKMVWQESDFAINDNLGNSHYAAPGKQTRRSRAGLRILHRTTIAGEVVPRKAGGCPSWSLK